MARNRLRQPSSADPVRLNLFWPFSGGVQQDILPWTWWLRVMGQWGLININLGRTPDPELERRILDEVGSYGRQLGRISEALDAVIETQLDRAKLEDKHIAAIYEFRRLLEDVKRLKQEQ